MTSFTLISCSLKPNPNTYIPHFFWTFLLAASTSLGGISGRCCIQVPVFHFCSCAPRRLTEANELKLLGEQELANSQTSMFLQQPKKWTMEFVTQLLFGQTHYINSYPSKTFQLPIYSTNHLKLCFSSKLWCMPGFRKPLDDVASPHRYDNKVKSKYILQQFLFSKAILHT